MGISLTQLLDMHTKACCLLVWDRKKDRRKQLYTSNQICSFSLHVNLLTLNLTWKSLSLTCSTRWPKSKLGTHAKNHISQGTHTHMVIWYDGNACMHMHTRERNAGSCQPQLVAHQTAANLLSTKVDICPLQGLSISFSSFHQCVYVCGVAGVGVGGWGAEGGESRNLPLHPSTVPAFLQSGCFCS